MAEAGCYRPRYLNIQRPNYLWTIRHSSARSADNLITYRNCRRDSRARAYPPLCVDVAYQACMSIEPSDRGVLCWGCQRAKVPLAGRGPVMRSVGAGPAEIAVAPVTGQLAGQIQRDRATVIVSARFPVSRLRPEVWRPAAAAGNVGKAGAPAVTGPLRPGNVAASGVSWGTLSRAPEGKECGRGAGRPAGRTRGARRPAGQGRRRLQQRPGAARRGRGRQ